MPAGRKSKLTTKLREELCGYIADGLTNKDAARLSGTSETRFYAWLERGTEEETGIYREFREQVVDARSKFKQKHLQTLTVASISGGRTEVKHVKKMFDEETGQYLGTLAEDVKVTRTGPNVNAAMWLLERSFPQEYGRRQALEHSGQIDTPVKVIKIPDYDGEDS